MEGMSRFHVSHSELMAASELSHRIICWRENVEKCSAPTSFSQIPHHTENAPSSTLRLRNYRLRKPYTRPPPPVSALHQLSQNRDSEFLHAELPFLDVCHARGVPEVVHPRRIVEEHLAASGCTPSIHDSSFLVLPHPEHNPLIADHQDVLEEEYFRLLVLFGKLSSERTKAECQWINTASTEAMSRVMHLGPNIRRVVDAAQYVIKYSHVHGWNINFEAIEYAAYSSPNARSVPSRVRELVCSPVNIMSATQDSTVLYPAA